MNFSPDITKGLGAAWEYRSEPERMRMLAAYFWCATLSLAVVAAFSAGFYGVWVFTGIFRGVGEDAPALLAPTPFTRVQIAETLEHLRERAARYESLEASPPPAPDPLR